jgi:2-polyprenyl-3-methyl-5-hydroxy-6-metoxy-1,4-benzoquinol methylase
MSFPSGIDVGTRNVLRLLRRYLQPGLRYLEVGCAPGKILSWVGRELGAPVAGIDYSPVGFEMTSWLCGGLGIEADIRCEDALENSFEKKAFDLVFSCGLIEHFEDPGPMVAAHAELVAPGGCAVIAIPNYSGLYSALQRRFDPENLAIHNLDIMSEKAMQALAPAGGEYSSRVFKFGRFSPWLVSLPGKYGKPGLLLSWMLNFAAMVQPLDIGPLCPLIVLEVRRSAAADSSHTPR